MFESGHFDTDNSVCADDLFAWSAQKRILHEAPRPPTYTRDTSKCAIRRRGHRVARRMTIPEDYVFSARLTLNVAPNRMAHHDHDQSDGRPVKRFMR